VADGFDQDDVRAVVAAVEQESEHPLAKAVVRHADARGVPAPRAARFENQRGRGARIS
jgi:P-type Cu2+ transporter